MHRIALLAAAFALAACSARSPWAGGSAKSPVATPETDVAVVGTAPAAAGESGEAVVTTPSTPAKYSWQAKKESEESTEAKQPATGAPTDETRARILALRLESGMLAFARKEKPDDGAFLQITKGDKALLIRVLRSDDTMTVADIPAGQDPAKTPTLEVGDEVGCGTPSDLPPQ